jgi:hypothetical protein
MAPTTICPRPAAPDRHGNAIPPGPVAPPLSPFGPRRGWVGQITVHGHLAAQAMKSIIYGQSAIASTRPRLRMPVSPTSSPSAATSVTTASAGR